MADADAGSSQQPAPEAHIIANSVDAGDLPCAPPAPQSDMGATPLFCSQPEATSDVFHAPDLVSFPAPPVVESKPAPQKPSTTMKRQGTLKDITSSISKMTPVVDTFNFEVSNTAAAHGLHGPKAMLSQMLYSASMSFIQNDENNDKRLDFNEFRKTLPVHLCESPEEVVQELFNIADVDGDGCISQTEYFMASMRWAVENSGASSILKDTFKAFDKTGDGQLNLQEFTEMADNFGFGDVGHVVFQEMDFDQSGCVSYNELYRMLKARCNNMSYDAKRLITTCTFVGFQHDRCAQSAMALDVTPFKAEEAEEVRQVVQSRMLAAMAKPLDVWHLLLQSCRASRKLTRPKFLVAMRKALGYHGSSHLLESIFDELDDDLGGIVSYPEFLDWINGKPQRRRRARMLNLRDHREESDSAWPDIVWSESLLRKEFLNMLSRTDISPLDLVNAHDKTETGMLNKKEFLVMLKGLIGCQEVWEASNVKSIVIHVYNHIKRRDGNVDVQRLLQWLNKSESNHDGKRSPKLQLDGEKHRSQLEELNLTAFIESPSTSPKYRSPLPLTTPSRSERLRKDLGFAPLSSSFSLPAIRKPSNVNLKFITMRAGRLKAAAERADMDARRVELEHSLQEGTRSHLAKARTLLSLEHARTLASDAEADRVKIAKESSDNHRSQQSRRRLIRERERREALLGLNGGGSGNVLPARFPLASVLRQDWERPAPYW